MVYTFGRKSGHKTYIDVGLDSLFKVDLAEYGVKRLCLSNPFGSLK